jgi:hypothetical protein
MTCVNKTCSDAYTLPSPIRASWYRPAFITAFVTIVDAFQEALALRRAAHRANPLDDQ